MTILNGTSWSKGFIVLFYYRKARISIRAESKEFSADNPDFSLINFRKQIIHLFRLLLPLFLLAHCLFFWKGNIVADLILLIILTIFIRSSVALIITLRHVVLTAKQWHSCEHKLIGLLKKIIRKNSVQDLTVYNLARQLRMNWACGTTMHVFFPLALFLLYVVGVLMPVKFLLIPFGYHLYFGTPTVILGAIIFFVVLFIASYLVQFFFWTAKPTQEQLEETIRVGKEFIEKYKQAINGSLK